MKILVNATVVAPEKLTGIERYTLRISQELYKINNDIEIVCSGSFPGVPSVTQPVILKIARQLLGRSEYIFRALWDQTFFRYYVAKTKPDVVFFPIQDGFVYPSAKQIITIYDLHYHHFDKVLPDCNNEINYFRTRLYYLKMPHLLEHSSAVIAISETTKQDIVDLFKVNPEKIHVIYCGYDDLRFRVISNPQPILERYGLESGNYFLFVGSILKHKNIVRLVQAFAGLNCQAQLVIAGVCKDSNYLMEIRTAAMESGVAEARLRYLEYVSDEDIPYLYNGAISYLLPSMHEGFGIPLIEAMACGTPVITSNCSAMPEVAGDAALLVDPYSAESIAAAMREILDNPRLVAELRAAGLKRSKMFRWSHSARKLYDVCKTVSES